MKPRFLKIEHPTPNLPPQIRLKGLWLAAAGFPAGQRVTVTQTGRGRLELVLYSPIEPAPSTGRILAALEKATQI